MGPAAPAGTGAHAEQAGALRAGRLLRRRSRGKAGAGCTGRRWHLDPLRPARLPHRGASAAALPPGRPARADQRATSFGRRRGPRPEPGDAPAAGLAQGPAGAARAPGGRGPAPCLSRSRPARRSGPGLQSAAATARAGLPEGTGQGHRPAARHAQLHPAVRAGLARGRPHHAFRGHGLAGQRRGGDAVDQPAIRRGLHRARHWRFAQRRDGRLRQRSVRRQRLRPGR
ncbi:hypothetical protein D3C81_1339750 [compost metagenome]